MMKKKLMNAYFTFNIQRDILNIKNKRFSKRKNQMIHLKILFLGYTANGALKNSSM